MSTRTRPTRRMRVSSILSEAGRNLATGTSRALLITLIAAAAIGGAAAFDVRTVVGLSADAVAFRDSGAAVHVLSAPGGVSGQRCDALGAVPGIRGASAVRVAGTQATILTAPSSGMTTIEATVGLDAVLGRPGAGTGAWLSDAAAEAVGADVGTTLPTSLGPVTVSARYPYPADAADRSLAYSLVTPVPAVGQFDACWVRVWPDSQAIEPLIRGTYSGDPADQSSVTLGQLTTRLGAAFNGPALFENRTTRRTPLVAAVVGLVLGIGAIRARRLELAGARHAQVSTTALVVQVLMELSAVGFATAVITSPVTYVLATSGNPDPTWPAWSAGLRVIATGTLAIVLGGAVASATTSEKRLFRYFKER